MKKIFRNLKKHWLTVWLFVAVVAVGAFVAYAAYTGIYSVKRVVSMTEPAGVLFSSNSMQAYSGSAIPIRHISTSQESGNYTYNLTVCDFAQSDPLTRYVSDSGIPYKLTAQLFVKRGDNYYPLNDTTNVSQAIRDHAASKTYTIKYASDGGDPVTSGDAYPLTSGEEVCFDSQLIKPQGTINATANGTNKYAIVFDEYELGDEQTNDYYIKLTAHPTNGDSTLQDLACYLYLTKSVIVDSAWSGKLQETGNTSDYDAYNYIIEGVGTGTVTVRWNSSFIDVSEFFIAQNGLTVFLEPEDEHGNIWKYFNLPVGEATGSSKADRYEIQLYKNNLTGDYSNVSTYIRSSYTAS